jgi:protein involved in polysaccharide export with SLBB domain
MVMLAAALAALHAPAGAQAPRPGTAAVTRPELNALLARNEAAAASAGSRAARARAQTDARMLRTRLEQGDFQTGDRVLLTVEGHTELTDTFTVSDGPSLLLPVIGAVPLAGVLRSELPAHLRGHLGRFIRDPALHARSTVRIAVLGEVGAPGYYVVSSEALVSDALMVAGGPTGKARVDGMRIERGDERVLDGDDLQQAISEGRTFDALSLRAGDRIVVPGRSTGTLAEAGRVIVWVIPAAVALIGLF